MPAKITVLGVHPVPAEEPCHLVEVFIEGLNQQLDFGTVQEVEGQPRANWQVPWDEQLIEANAGKSRYAFFFHYRALSKPLLMPLESVSLPPPTKMPKHLKRIKYEAP